MSGILAAADESRAQSTRCQKAQARLGSVGACPGNQMKRRRGLGDLLARRAAELFAHVWITFALLVPRGTTIAVAAAMALLSRWTRLFTDALRIQLGNASRNRAHLNHLDWLWAGSAREQFTQQ